MKYLFVPYKYKSLSVQNLIASEVNFYRTSRKNRFLKLYSPGDAIINWGCSSFNFVIPDKTKIVNSPLSVRLASNKLLAFRVLTASGVPTPTFTTDVNVAYNWNKSFIARGSLTGTGGKDAVYFDTDNLPPADEIEDDYKMYSQYIHKTYEYRVHVFNGKVISIQQKRKRNGFNEDPNSNQFICNHDKGWVFCRDKVDPPNTSVTDSAISAVYHLGLDFGAVDVVYDGKAYVLEVNTAPGLQGSTVHEYARALKRAYG